MPAGYFGHVAGVGGRQGGEARPVHFGLMFTGIKRRRSRRQRVPNEPEGREGRAAVQTKVRAGTPESAASRAKAQTRTTPRSLFYGDGSLERAVACSLRLICPPAFPRRHERPASWTRHEASRHRLAGLGPPRKKEDASSKGGGYSK